MSAWQCPNLMVEFKGVLGICSVNLSQEFFPGTLKQRKRVALPVTEMAFPGCSKQRGWNNLSLISPHPYPSSRVG